PGSRPPLRTRTTGEDATGWRTFDPSYRSSESGESLHAPADEPVFHDHKEGESFGLLGLFAAEEGIIRHPWDRLEGSDWWDAVDAARDAGAPIPEYDTTDTAEHMTVLPPSVRDLSTATSGWDWRHAAKETDLTIDDVRDRTTDAIADAYGSGDRVLIEALPTMGKSYGSIKAAAETDEPVTILTGRGRKEQYDQLREWCEEHGLTYKTLPSFTRDCETANGEHGEDWAEKVRGWYNRGATPKAIHAFAEEVLGRALPCQAQEGHRCTYAAKWDFDPETDGSGDPEEDIPIDVLIGHYTHAYKPKVTTGRTVVFDEHPNGAFETVLGPELQGAVSYWLETTGGIPFDSYTDLLENRDDESRRSDALLWFEENGIEPDETRVFDDRNAHATAPLAVFTLLASDDLENGFERADLGEHGLGIFNRANGSVSILQPPALDYTTGTVALDGTPTKRMWELSLGERLTHRQVLQDGERTEYLRDALNLNIVPTTEYVKPYNSPDHVNTEEDGALLEAIAKVHGEKPGVITTTTAEHEYDAEGLLEYVDETKHYGNVLGSNEFKEKRLGAVVGSNHYGDGYIKKWGAYAGETVERGEGKGADLSYTGIGEKILTHMREHDTLQAVMRFGRDGNGAVVYTHTNTLPEWVPIASEGRVLKTWSDGMRDVLTALEDMGTATTEAIVDHPAVDLSRQQAFSHLEELRDRDVLERMQDTEDGRRVVWIDDGLHRLGEHGEAELDPVDLEELTDTEVRQVARSSIYTWDFTNREGSDTPEPVRAGSTPSTPGTRADPGGNRPPDPAD
ncbi:MarR family transcriptional regulator, partial [Halopenitus salinus]|uniref:MarR family transcriptional regulator n=1 Tax=Halopenitus salinus TaxID=1198295 RepID=UPI00361EF390